MLETNIEAVQNYLAQFARTFMAGLFYLLQAVVLNTAHLRHTRTAFVLLTLHGIVINLSDFVC